MIPEAIAFNYQSVVSELRQIYDRNIYLM